MGLSQVRESVFSALPITATAAERNCGVWIVDIRSGDIAGFLRFSGVVQEIFEVAAFARRTGTELLLPGVGEADAAAVASLRRAGATVVAVSDSSGGRYADTGACPVAGDVVRPQGLRRVGPEPGERQGMLAR